MIMVQTKISIRNKGSDFCLVYIFKLSLKKGEVEVDSCFDTRLNNCIKQIYIKIYILVQYI